MQLQLTNNKLYITIDSLGAQLMSLRDLNGIEYLWQGNEKYWKGRSPILFPIVGALRNKKTIIDGLEYTMPQHGLARINEFKLKKKFTDSAVYTFVSNDETKRSYPFDFELEVTYTISDFSIIVSFNVINKDSKSMPFGLGGHPGFNIPIFSDENFEDYKIQFEKIENCDSPVIDMEQSLIVSKERISVLENSNSIKLKHELFYNDALVLENLKSRGVSMHSVETGRGIKMDFDGFDYLGIWQAPDAPFVCLEPWTSTATLDIEDDDLRHKRGIIELAPGESKEFSFKITIL